MPSPVACQTLMSMVAMDILAACGFSSRGMNELACDRFLMVFDLRMMRAVTPLQVHVDPLFLHFIPTYTSRLAIISQTGIDQMGNVFVMQPASCIYQTAENN